ncbi:MAG: hypothetical protein WA783_19250 [Phormidesmis sp.]
MKDFVDARSLRSPMEVGTIIGTAWRLYRSNLSRYLPLSLRGSAWLFLPVILLLVGLLWMLSQGVVIENLSGLFALLIPAWIVLVLWCNAQSLGEFSAISRLVYQSLSVPMGAESESLSESLRFTRSRKFSLLGSAAIQWVISAVVSIVSLFIYSIALGMIVIGFGVFSGQPSPGMFLGGGALLLISIVALTWFSIWVAMRLLVTEQSLAIETNSGAIASIGRSWRLMKKHALRATGIMILAGLICLPVLIVTGIGTQIVQVIVLRAAGVTVSPTSPPAVLFLSSAVSYAMGLLSGIVGGIIIGPFLRAVVTTLYFDIRNRKEILDA